jgi:hypothetical protein
VLIQQFHRLNTWLSQVVLVVVLQETLMHMLVLLEEAQVDSERQQVLLYREV